MHNVLVDSVAVQVNKGSLLKWAALSYNFVMGFAPGSGVLALAASVVTTYLV